MSETTSSVEDVKEKVVLDHDSEKKDQFDDDDDKDNKDQIFDEEVKDSDENEKGSMPSAQQEEEAIKKKYGGLLPRKPPLISKDHERAFFDSADWALGKQGAQKPKGPLEALRPKLQPTPHQRSRRSAYAPADDTEVDHDNDQSCSLDKDGNDSIANEDHDKDKSQSG